MKASELIELLQEFIEDNGDLEVLMYGWVDAGQYPVDWCNVVDTPDGKRIEIY